MSLPPEGYTVTWTGFNGDEFTLASPEWESLPEQPVLLTSDGFSGSSAKRERTTRKLVTGLGERVVSWSVPAMSSTLEVGIFADPGDLSGVLRRWRRSWHVSRPGVMRVSDQFGESVQATMYLTDTVPDLPYDPRGQSGMKDSVKWTCLEGHWLSGATPHTGQVSVTAGGDLPPSLRLVWLGWDTTLTLPGGAPISLTGGGNIARYINLDRGMSGHVTRVDSGATDAAMWAALGMDIGGLTLTPGQPTNWNLGPGLTLEVFERYMSPWR